MKYADGSEIEPGDVIKIASTCRGKVVASMDGRCLPGEEGWAYLREGIVVDTDFGGLVHYTAENAEDFVLLDRP